MPLVTQVILSVFFAALFTFIASQLITICEHLREIRNQFCKHDAPPEHMNCRCVPVPIDERTAKESNTPLMPWHLDAGDVASEPYRRGYNEGVQRLLVSAYNESLSGRDLAVYRLAYNAGLQTAKK